MKKLTFTVLMVQRYGIFNSSPKSFNQSPVYFSEL